MAELRALYAASVRVCTPGTITSNIGAATEVLDLPRHRAAPAHRAGTPGGAYGGLRTGPREPPAQPDQSRLRAPQVAQPNPRKRLVVNPKDWTYSVLSLSETWPTRKGYRAPIGHRAGLMSEVSEGKPALQDRPGARWIYRHMPMRHFPVTEISDPIRNGVFHFWCVCRAC